MERKLSMYLIWLLLLAIKTHALVRLFFRTRIGPVLNSSGNVTFFYSICGVVPSNLERLFFAGIKQYIGSNLSCVVLLRNYRIFLRFSPLTVDRAVLLKCEHCITGLLLALFFFCLLPYSL